MVWISLRRSCLSSLSSAFPEFEGAIASSDNVRRKDEFEDAARFILQLFLGKIEEDRSLSIYPMFTTSLDDAVVRLTLANTYGKPRLQPF